MAGILPFFTFGLCVGVVCVLLCIAPHIWEFPWSMAWRRFRFSLAALLAFISVLSIALALHRLQQQTPTLRYVPFPAMLLICFIFFGGMIGLATEIRSCCRSSSSRRSALKAYRDRQQDVMPAFSPAHTSQRPSAPGPVRQKARGKWWLRRMPNRFRSISHRDAQETRTSGYNNKDH